MPNEMKKNKTPSEAASQQRRCDWCSEDPVYIQYHDNEWGIPCRDEVKLFEMLLLEGAQAGLSWITVLKKRDHYRKVFDDFNPKLIATYSEAKVSKLLDDPGIIRNKLKIQAFIENAKTYLRLKEQDFCLSDYLWSYVNHNPIRNNYKSMKELPSKTDLSDTISKDLKKKGFKFVGSVTIYAYMQAIGMVNDHLQHCWKYEAD